MATSCMCFVYFVQIFDRLASSIGQDVLDSFYYVLSLKQYRRKDILPLVFYSAVAAVYIRILHTLNTRDYKRPFDFAFFILFSP